MKIRRIPLALAVAAAVFNPASPAFAAALGEVASLSALGERFRAEIRLEADGAIQADCFRVVAPADSSDGIPALAGGRVSIAGKGSGARLIVRSDRTVEDPILRLAVENVCDTRLRREYTLMMPFTAAATVGAPVATQPARASVPDRKPAAERRATPPRTERPRAPKPATRTWSTAPGESLASLGEALYPDDPAARERFTRATAAANPGLFPTPASHERALPTGTRVLIPDLRQVANAAAGKPAPTSDRSRTASPAQAAPQPTGDRVVVDKSVTAASSAAAQANASRDAAAEAGVPQGLLEREREVAAAIDRSIVAEMELLARVKELEELQAALEARLRTTLASQAASAQAAPAPAAVAAAAPPAPAAAPAASAETGSPAGDLYLLGGLGLAALLLTAWLLRGRRETRPASVADADTRIPPTVARPAPSTTSAPLTEPAADASAGLRPGTVTLREHATGHGTAVEEYKSAVELADIMVSFGRVQGAAETLAEFVRSNPREAVTPWLKLREVYRTAGLRAEFDTIARELNKTFNVNAVDWDNYQVLRASQTSLEDLPHISEALQKSWRTPACQRYLQRLLRDNRDGTRIGFPFPVIDEILTLSAILEDERGPCPRPDTGAQAPR